jgi:hypothetical protein
MAGYLREVTKSLWVISAAPLPLTAPYFISIKAINQKLLELAWISKLYPHQHLSRSVFYLRFAYVDRLPLLSPGIIILIEHSSLWLQFPMWVYLMSITRLKLTWWSPRHKWGLLFHQKQQGDMLNYIKSRLYLILEHVFWYKSNVYL